MQKNWLIRTKDNNIWGPVTKDKIIELYQNGTIKPEDEVCSGNGYWFHIKEKELVDRFLLKNENQGFNPLSIYDDSSIPTLEIEAIPTPNSEKQSTQVINLKDLEASGANLEETNVANEENMANESQDIATTGEPVEKKNETFSLITQEKIESQPEIVETHTESVSSEVVPIIDLENKKALSDILLLALAAVLLIVAVLAFNNRNELIKTFLDKKFSFNSAQAQEGSENLVKKKEFFCLIP